MSVSFICPSGATYSRFFHKDYLKQRGAFICFEAFEQDDSYQRQFVVSHRHSLEFVIILRGLQNREN